MGNYKLTVGNVAGITTTTNGTDCKFGNNTFYVSIQTLTYSKRIFAPGEIHTVLSLTAKDNNSATPTLSQLQDTFSRKKVTLIDTTPDPDVTLADNYFVYKMKPCRSKNSEGSVILKVELSIFSMDKLMTIDKYCNVFTAKRLGEDIFKGELKKFWLDSKNQLKGEVNMQMLAFKNQGTKAASEIRQPYLVQYNETFYDFLSRSAVRCGEMLYFEGGQLHLGMEPNLKTATIDQMGVADSIDYEDCVEKVLAVQERHYNFMKRSSDNDNRYTDSYSELLGDIKNTDDDDLDKETKAEKDRIEAKKNKSTEGKVENGLVTETTELEFERGKVTKTVQTTYYKESDGNPDKELKGHPKQMTTTISVTDSGGNELWKQTQTVNYIYEKIDENHYRKEHDDYAYRVEETLSLQGQEVEGIYNQPEANDANFEELKKDGYTTFYNEWFDERLVGLGIVTSLMNNTCLYDFISDLVWTLLQTTKDAKVTMDKKNKMNNDKNLTLNKKNNPEQTNGSDFNLFSTLSSLIDNEDLNVNKRGDIVSLLMADFYAKVRRASQTVSKMLVRLDYGASDKGLCLGDVINVEGGFYVVIKVELDENNNYIVEAIRPYYEQINTDKNTITAAIPCPPLMLEISTVRTAEAQVAFVEDNLDPNRFGRVRVRYPWQPKNGDKSPWIRMATPFATAGGGVTFRPCTGDEVLLNYEDGNIERPYIVGSLQSRYVTDPWLPLPDRVIRSKNGHSITFNDSTDGMNFIWGLFPGASMLRSFVPTYKPIVKNQDMVDLTGGINISDRYGLYQINMSSDKRRVYIASPLGNISLNAFTGIAISAPNGNVKIEGKNVLISASNKLTLTSGTGVSDHYVNPPEEPKKVESWVKWGLGAVGEDVLDRTVGKLLDLTFIRTVFEVFTRPVDGTLKIRSNSYLLMEAGPGTVKLNDDLYKEHPKLDKLKSPGENLANWMFTGKINNAIDMLTSRVDIMASNIEEAHKALKTATDSYKRMEDGLYNHLTKMKLEGADTIISYVYNNKNKKPEKIITEDLFGFDDVADFLLPERIPPQQGENETRRHYRDILNQYNTGYLIANREPLDNRATVVSQATEVAKKLISLFKAVDAWKNFEFTKRDKLTCYTSDDLRDQLRGLDLNDNYIRDVSGGTVNLERNWTNFGNEKTILKRKILYQLIVEAKDADYYKWMFGVAKDTREPQNYTTEEWKIFTDAIGQSTAKADTFLTALGFDAKKGLRHYFIDGKVSPWMDTFTNVKSKWSSTVKPRILISDKEGKTIQIVPGNNGTMGLESYDNPGPPNSAYPDKLKEKLNQV